MLDSTDRRINDRAAGKPREVIHRGPEILDVARIFSHEPAFEVADRGYGGFIRTHGVSFTPTVNALVRQHLHVAEIPSAHSHEGRLNVGDLERWFTRIARFWRRLRGKRQADGSTLDQKITSFHVRSVLQPRRSAVSAGLVHYERSVAPELA